MGAQLGARKTTAARLGELQYLAHVFGKQVVLVSMELTMIPLFFPSSSAVSLSFGRNPYVEELGPISPLCC